MAHDPENDPRVRAVEFGRRLRQAREASGVSLRDIQSRSGLNNGYLSQLETGKITFPSPTILQKVARGYFLAFEDVMKWAGYVSEAQEPVTPNQAVALSTVSALGEPSDEELQALRAIVELLQKNRSSTFTPPSDLPLDEETIAEIKRHAHDLLQHAGALGKRPTPLEDIREAARLVLAGEITLDARDRRRLTERFGHWVTDAWRRLQGVFDYRTSAIWIAPDLHEMKKRFVLSHEIGHAILPAHKKTFAFVDDFTCLPPISRSLLEREANQAAAEILFQAGEATEEFDSSPPSMQKIVLISTAFGASIVATARFVAETSKRPVAVAVAHRRVDRGFGRTHIYASQSFLQAFGRPTVAALPQLRPALCTSYAGGEETWIVNNLAGEARLMNIEKKFTGYDAIVLLVPGQVKRIPAQRILRAAGLR